MAHAVGPCFTGGFENYVVLDESGEQYTILYLPDRNNDELQREGKPPVYYWMPDQVRLARKGDTGDYKFHHIHFVGVFGKDVNVGLDKAEVQGGVLTFTTTTKYPTAVLKQSEAQLQERWRGKDDKYWGWRGIAEPHFRIAPIASNITVLTNLAPGPDGTMPEQTGDDLPVLEEAPPVGDTLEGTPPAEGTTPRSRDGKKARWGRLPRRALHGSAFRGPPNVNAWAWKMQGQGPGAVTGGENAYSGLLGAIPSEIIWAGFHGAYSPIVVSQSLQLPFWSQLMRIKITSDWTRVFDHFSTAASGRYLWVSADIKTEFNNLRMKEAIKVELDIDGTMQGGSDLEKQIQARIDLILKEWMEQAKKAIFDPPPPTVPPADASGGIRNILSPWSAGFSLKQRKDVVSIHREYEETRYFRYLQPHTISSSMEGFFNEIKKDPGAEKKYFTRLVLGELGQKVHRIVKPVVNWPDASEKWVGEPVAFLSAQVGYVDSQGAIQWQGHIFQNKDSDTTNWQPVFVRRREGEVSNPPPDWSVDKTFVKRKVHLLEPPGESHYDNMKTFVEINELALDPEPNGTITNDNIVEVRADQVGMLDVGPMSLNVALDDSKQIVEVEFRALGNRVDGTDRSEKITRFRWEGGELKQFEPRYWRIFTGQSDFIPKYEYRVNVTVRGTLLSKGMAWSGAWQSENGNGALIIRVPGPDDEGVAKRSLTPAELISAEPILVNAGSGSAATTGPKIEAPRSRYYDNSEHENPKDFDREERTLFGYDLREDSKTTEAGTPRIETLEVPEGWSEVSPSH